MIETRSLTNAEILARTRPDAGVPISAERSEKLKDGAENHIDRLADDMRDIAAVAGSCEAADLILRGWTPEALAAHADAARDLANAATAGGSV